MCAEDSDSCTLALTVVDVGYANVTSVLLILSRTSSLGAEFLHSASCLVNAFRCSMHHQLV